MSLWLHPGEVELLGVTLGPVLAVGVNRRATRAALEWSDAGPEVVFADAPEQRVDVTIVRETGGDGAGLASAITPGAEGILKFAAGPTASDARRVDVSATVVVLSVEHDLRSEKSAKQTIRCVAISSDGAADPISEIEATA